MRAPLLIALATATSACFSGGATVGSICMEDRDCGQGQGCENEVCGRCGNGARDEGEVCIGEDDSLGLNQPVVALATADLDGDGDGDLVAWEAAAPRFHVGLSDGEGFAWTVVDTSAEVVAIGLGDLHADDAAEVVVGTLGGRVEAYRIGDGPVAVSAVETAGYPGSIVVGDLDGDGPADVVVGDSDGQATVVLRGAGDGMLGMPDARAGCAGVVVEAVADITQDLRADVVLTCTVESRVLVLAGTGGGGLEQAIAISPSATALGTMVADLDGDLDLDLVVRLAIPAVELWHGRNGDLEGPTRIDLDARAEAAAVADLNYDTRPEVVLADVDGFVVLPSRFGVFPDRARRSFTPAPIDFVAVDRTGLSARDLAVATDQGVLLFPESP